MKRVVGLGACVLDTIISCGEYPREDTKMQAKSIMQTGGGPVANALVVMSRLGTRAEVIGSLGGDSAADFLVADFVRLGVGVDSLTRIPGATSFVSFITLSERDGTRTCVFDRGSVADDPECVKLGAIDGAAVLHLDGNYLRSAIAAAKYAREHGVKVSLDAGGRYAGIEELLPLVDILIPSAEFALGITGAETIPEAMSMLAEKYSPEVLAVTDGARGGYYLDSDGIRHYETRAIRPVDTNGAGDTFHGAFISAYVDGMSIGDCCRFASAVASYKCEHKGARDYPLTREIALDLMSKE